MQTVQNQSTNPVNPLNPVPLRVVPLAGGHREIFNEGNRRRMVEFIRGKVLAGVLDETGNGFLKTETLSSAIGLDVS